MSGEGANRAGRGFGLFGQELSLPANYFFFILYLWKGMLAGDDLFTSLLPCFPLFSVRLPAVLYITLPRSFLTCL